MTNILILREELVCFLLLLFLFFISIKYKKVSEIKYFLTLIALGITHTLFDGITVIMVNHLDTVNPLLNKICHSIFYVSALLYCSVFLRYVVSIVEANKFITKFSKFIYLVPIIFTILIPILGITYKETEYTNYSYGPITFLGFGMALLVFFLAFFLVLFNIKKLNKFTRRSLIPMCVIMAITIVVQALYPQLLFTGGDITLLTIGVFFTIANPMNDLEYEAHNDTLSMLNNRNAYTRDTVDLDNKYGKEAYKRMFACVSCDLNGLKKINDTKGHEAGDELIRAFAEKLKANLKNSFGIYRIGGDEFVAFYENTNEEIIEKEIENLLLSCKNERTKNNYLVSSAVAYSIARGDDTIFDVIERSDKKMYENKKISKGNRKEKEYIEERF